MLQFGGRLGAFDHARLREDLRSMPGPIAGALAHGRILQPPMALLERYGDDLLHATRDDTGAWALRTDTAMQAWMDGRCFLRVLDGAVGLSWLAVAVVLGRVDLRPRFRGVGGLDYDEALRWLVLYGIHEHGLFGLATRQLVEELLAPVRPGGPAALAVLLLRERPDLLPLCRERFAAGFTPGLRAWLATSGVGEYGLHWCVAPRELDGAAEAAVLPPPGWLPPAVPPPAPGGRAPGLEGRCVQLRLEAAGAGPDWLSAWTCRAPVAAAGQPEGVDIWATDMALRLPHPGGRRATFIIRAAPWDGAAAGEATLVALHRGRPIGGARFRPRAGGTVALTLRGITPGDELPVRLCLLHDAAPVPSGGAWARWISFWLIAE